MERKGNPGSKFRMYDANDYHFANFGVNGSRNMPTSSLHPLDKAAPASPVKPVVREDPASVDHYARMESAFRREKPVANEKIVGSDIPIPNANANPSPAADNYSALDELKSAGMDHAHPSKGKGKKAEREDQGEGPTYDSFQDSPSKYLEGLDVPVTVASPLQSQATIDQASIAQRLRDYSLPPPHGVDDWVRLPEVPTALELASIVDGRATNREITIIPNRLDSPWDSVLEYLEAQYGLMREDAVATLREVVEELRRDPFLMEADSMSNAQIYERVYISGITVANDGVAHRLDFSTGRAKRRIAWQSSKRLKPGTLVALTPVEDHFHRTCLVATVAARPFSQLEEDPPAVDVYFSDADAFEIDPQVEYLMVESSTGYYEACRHTLKALQHLSRERFPLAEHLVSLQRDMSAPNSLIERPTIDLRAAFEEGTGPSLTNVLSSWPTVKHNSGVQRPSHNQLAAVPATDLDESQFEALRRILTKRLAIVQGPPGTGKTHVSVIALKVLVENKAPGTPPIIVTAQTNHALDQLLRHIAPFAPDFIRLGGQTQDFNVIEPRTLFNVKHGEASRFKELKKALGMARARSKGVVRELKELLEPLMCSTTMSPEIFLKYHLITDDQFQSLSDSAEDWVGDSGANSSDAILAWAKSHVQPFKRTPPRVQDPSQLEAEDDDFYAEKDAFLERGVFESDDKDMLMGPKFIFKSGFTAAAGVYDTTNYVHTVLGKFSNLYDVPVRARGLVYLWLQGQVKSKIRERFRELAKILYALSGEVRMLRNQLDANYLKEAPVVGMTTTGLSKYRAMLHSIQPQVVLIEEAAETQEAYVTAACFDSLEQLILVGDHQQLRAQCQSKGMEEFNLHISLFERLVEHNDIDFQQLVLQRRMLPEMRYILNVIYPKLTDHPCVRGREDIPGMGGQNTWFMTHSMEETMDDHFSWVNDEEAHIVAKFYEYLVINGTPADNITIITFYNGQKRKILSVLRKLDRFVTAGQMNVCTVDSYQGEENEVIILSLVRNNQRDKGIGFLNVNNRVCVAMSRARRGFYIFGNARQLHDANSTWRDLIWRFSETGSVDGRIRLGKHIPVVCSNHGNKVEIRTSIDWNSTSGGCNLRCGQIRSCGHACPLFCHPDPHDELPCFEPCNAKLECGHACSGLCNDSPCQCKICENRAKNYDRRRHEHNRIQDEQDPLSPRYSRRVVKNEDRSLKPSADSSTYAAVSRGIEAEQAIVVPQRLSELTLSEIQPAPASAAAASSGLLIGAPVHGRVVNDRQALRQPPKQQLNSFGMRPQSEAERAAAVQGFQAFAQGGARRADEALKRQLSSRSNQFAGMESSASGANPSSSTNIGMMSSSSPPPRQPHVVVESTIVGQKGNRTIRSDRFIIRQQQQPKLEPWESQSDADNAQGAYGADIAGPDGRDLDGASEVSVEALVSLASDS